MQKTDSTGTTTYVGGLYEIYPSGSSHAVRKTYTFGGQSVAVSKDGVLSYLHSDHLNSASLATNTSGGKVAGSDIRYTPFGGTRANAPGNNLPTDRRYTGQREVADLGLYDYAAPRGAVARYYDPYIGRFIQADTIIPDPGSAQAYNRYSYAANNPLKYNDPTGHVKNNPDELQRAQDILDTLTNDYDVKIKKDWGYDVGRGYENGGWQLGEWTIDELEVVLKGVSDLADAMGGAQEFKQNLGGVSIMRKYMPNNPGEAMAHKVWLSSSNSLGFMGKWQGTWTVVHELGHAWDAANGWKFSRQLERETGGWTLFAYNHGGTPPKGADANFTRGEDFAESLTTFVYPQEAQAFIQKYYGNISDFQYNNYYLMPRAEFIAEKLNMDPAHLHELANWNR